MYYVICNFTSVIRLSLKPDTVTHRAYGFTRYQVHSAVYALSTGLVHGTPRDSRSAGAALPLKSRHAPSLVLARILLQLAHRRRLSLTHHKHTSTSRATHTHRCGRGGRSIVG